MMLWLAFPGMSAMAKALAKEAGGEAAALDIHHFPDRETLVTLPEIREGCDIVIVATLQDPDRLALPLRFAAATARELGAGSVGLVAPYLAYMRQDHRFAPGQAVSAPIFAEFLQESVDWIVTADPHLHRIASLSEIFTIPAVCVETAPSIASWIRNYVPDALLVGPDSESMQWVAEVAKLAGRPFEVLEKTRSGDRKVEVSAPQRAALLSGTPVIIDDIASSGRTLIETIERLAAADAAAPVCVIIHAVFSGSAHDDILAAGATRIASTDSIPHESNAISLAKLLADGVASLTAGRGEEA